mgnify:CR=1 FL=1
MRKRARRPEDKAKRRVAILAAARRVFEDKGFDQTSMDDVAAEVQLSKGTVYLYFNSRDALFSALLEQYQQAVLADVEAACSAPGSGYDRLFEIGRIYCGFLEQHPAWARMVARLLTDPSKQLELGALATMEMRAAGDRETALLVDVVQLGVADGSLLPDTSPSTVAVGLFYALLGVAITPASQGGGPGIVRSHLDTYMRGLRRKEEF